ncbi:MAG: hypothetical protein Q9M10_02950, partial [Mariprofundaceae bacterium]|nr:hypothetical protein [Mariprofundaceae bacterium]
MSEPSKQSPTTFPLDEALAKAPQPIMAKPQKTHRALYLLLDLLLGAVITLAALPYIPINIANQLRLPTLIVMQPAAPTPPQIHKEAPTPSPTRDLQGLADLQASIHALDQRLRDIPPLKEGIQTLSNDVQALHQTQTTVRAAQINIEKMQLHSRLSWILHPSSHLPQIRLAWEEIVLLPSLTQKQRQQASDMLLLAEQRQMDIDHWQEALGYAIASYHITPTSSHNLLTDWLPKDGRFAGI